MSRVKFGFKYKNIFIWLCVFFSILMSKTYYFGVQYRSLYQYVFWGICFVCFLVIGKKPIGYKKTIITSIVLITLLLFNLLIYSFEMEAHQLNTTIGHILTIIVATLMITMIDACRFSYLYIRIIALFCIVSIPCFIIALFNPNLARQLCQPGYQWPDPAGFSPYYLWGINGMISTRNSGPFWEPGAFQGFINLAILLLLYNVDKEQIRNRLLYFILFAVTILTTRSAAGYFILLLIYAFQRTNIEGLVSGKHKKIFRLITILIGAVMIGYVFTSGIITSKLAISNGQFETVSASMRFADIKGGLSLILRGNIFGLGETANKNALKVLYGVNKDDSVGLMAMTYTYGICFSGVYIASMLYGIKSMFMPKMKKDYVFLMIIFFLLHMTEGLWFLPIYVYITLYRNQKKNIRRDYGILHHVY